MDQRLEPPEAGRGRKVSETESVCPPPNSYVEILTSIVMVLGAGPGGGD